MVGTQGTWRWIALAACALIAAAIVWAPEPDGSLRSALALHDFGHVVAFGLVTALLLFVMSGHARRGFRQRLRVAGLAIAAAVALGAVVELLQGLSGGDADVGDVLRDAGGAFVVAVIWLARDPGLSRWVQGALAAVAVLVLVPFTLPTLAAFSDEARARAQFPVLASFESEHELSRFQFATGENPRLTTTLDPQGRRVTALTLDLPPGPYPGLVLSYFPGDWRSMRALQLLLVNPGRTPLELWVRIDDADYDYRLDLADRYSGAFMLSPGATRIEIPLADVAAAPRGRQLDLGRVRSLLIYAVDLAHRREIILGPIALVQ